MDKHSLNAIRGAAIAALGASLLAGGTLPAAGPGSAPRTRVGVPVIDLGAVPAGPGVEATFAIKNDGGAVLHILGVATGCLCALAEFDSQVAPGGTGYVRVKLLTAQLQGPVTQPVTVTTDDPAAPRIVLTLRAEVVTVVELLPMPVMMLRDRGGAGPVGRMLVRRGSGVEGELAVRDLTVSVPWLVPRATRLAALRPRGEGLPEGRPGDWVIEVRFLDDLRRYGPQHGQVRFRTGIPAQPEAIFDVESDFTPPVTLSTSRLVLSGKPGAVRGTAFASVRDGLDPGLLRAESKIAGLEVRLERATGRMVKLDVRWAGAALSGGAIRLGIGDEWVELPVEWSTAP